MATDKISKKAADNYRLVKSVTLLTPAAATINLLQIPRRAFVSDVWLYVAVVGSTDTVTVGWTGNGETAQAAGFISAAIADVKKVGMKKAVKDTLVSADSKYFDTAGGQITMTVGTTQTTGRFYVFARFTIIY